MATEKTAPEYTGLPHPTNVPTFTIKRPVDAAIREKASLPGRIGYAEMPVQALATNEAGEPAYAPTGETREVIVQEGYGEWPFCTLCVPPKQVDPTQFSRHTNKHTVATVSDDDD